MGESNHPLNLPMPITANPPFPHIRPIHYRGSLQTARQSLSAQAKAIRNLAKSLGAEFNEVIKLILEADGRVIVSGLGKSGHVGQKMSATFASTGTPSFFLHPVEAFHGDLGKLLPGDLVLLLSNSGETEELIALVPCLRRLSCRIVVLCGDTTSTLARHADVALPVRVEREVCPNNLAPTTSSLAMMAMGDALAVALIKARDFKPVDFAMRHPGGSLGRRLLTKVEDVMRRDLPVIDPHTSFHECLLAMTQGRMGLVTVMEQGRLLGIITDGDLRRGLLRDRGITTKPAYAIMTTNPKTVKKSLSLADAECFMLENKIRALLVTEDESEKICGILEIFS